MDPKVFNTWRADNSMTCAFAAFFQWDNLKESPGFDPLLLQVELPSSLGSSAQLGACLQELQERLNTRIYQMTTRNTDKSLQNQVPGEELVVLGVDKRRATCLRGDNTFQGFSGCVIFSIQNIQKFFFKSLAFPSPKTACLKHHDAMESDDFGSCSETAHISVILILLLLLLLSSMIIVIFIYMLIKIEIWAVLCKHDIYCSLSEYKSFVNFQLLSQHAPNKDSHLISVLSASQDQPRADQRSTCTERKNGFTSSPSNLFSIEIV